MYKLQSINSVLITVLLSLYCWRLYVLLTLSEGVGGGGLFCCYSSCWPDKAGVLARQHAVDLFTHSPVPVCLSRDTSHFSLRHCVVFLECVLCKWVGNVQARRKRMIDVHDVVQVYMLRQCCLQARRRCFNPTSFHDTKCFSLWLVDGFLPSMFIGQTIVCFLLCLPFVTCI